MGKNNSAENSEYEKLLKQALKNPGIHEVSKLYDNYYKIAKQINSIESALHKDFIIITTNSSE